LLTVKWWQIGPYHSSHMDLSQQYHSGRLAAVILLLYGVSQGSVIGPVLFLLYVAEVIMECGLAVSAYADDIQVHVTSQQHYPEP